MNQRTRRVLALALAATVATVAWGQPKKGGKPGRAAATLAFDDLQGDAIRSDGSGPYEVSVGQDGIYTVISLSRKQEIHLDFSDCDPQPDLSCDGPFGPDNKAGYVAAAKLTITYLDGDPGGSDQVGMTIEFQTSEGKWKLGAAVDIARYDDDDDGSFDRYVFEDPGTTPASLAKYAGGGRFGRSTYIEHGRFFMPWGATLRVP